MEEFLNQLQNIWEKIYVYLPTILAIISAFGGVTIKQLGRLVASTRLYAENLKTLKTSVDQCIESHNEDLMENYEITQGLIATLEFVIQNAILNPEVKAEAQAKIDAVKSKVAVPIEHEKPVLLTSTPPKKRKKVVKVVRSK